jgi:AraC family transcriptional regulator
LPEMADRSSETKFGGKLVHSHSCCGVTLSEVEYLEVRQCGRHTHQQAFFAVVQNGMYEERYGRLDLRHRGRSVAFRPAGMTHQDRILSPGTHVFLIEIDKAWDSRIRECAAGWTPEPTACEGDASWLAARLLDALRLSVECSPLLVEGIVYDLLLNAARTSTGEDTRSPRWLGVAIDLIHAEFAESLGLERIASEVNVHPAYLSRVFRRVRGESIGHYVNRLRVRYAGVELTKDPSIPLCDVALAAGFADQSHFTKIFKQITGVTPGAFRSSIFGRGRIGRGDRGRDARPELAVECSSSLN